MKNLTAYFNRFALDLPAECVKDCSHSGSCDDDVEYWVGKIEITIPPEQIAAELKEYGAWDAEELEDKEQNIKRLIWIAAGNISEENRDEKRKKDRS